MSEETVNYKEISREGLIDMLEEADERLQEKSALIRELKKQLADTKQAAWQDSIAYNAALGGAVPAGCDGKLVDGIEPVNYLARHLNFEIALLKEKNEGLRLDNAEYIEWIEHLMLSGSHDDCPTCNDIEAFLQRLEEAKP